MTATGRPNPSSNTYARTFGANLVSARNAFACPSWWPMTLATSCAARGVRRSCSSAKLLWCMEAQARRTSCLSAITQLRANHEADTFSVQPMSYEIAPLGHVIGALPQLADTVLHCGIS